jgi:hypothetical protein
MGVIATALSAGTAVERNAPTPELDTTYYQDSIETQRELISIVGADDGSGPVRGIHEFQGVIYAFRDNQAQTACLMYKQSSLGWLLQSLGNRVPFLDDGSGSAYVEGETITGSSTLAHAVVKRIVLQSGAWGVDAAGYMILGEITGGPFQAEPSTGSITGAVPITGISVANEMEPGGRYELTNDNFFGSALTRRMYGVNGVSEAFEWDGDVFVPIITGNVTDTPEHITINEFHLQLSFPNGSLQNSATGNPYIWAGGGAAEVGVGHPIVGLVKEVGQVLIVLCRNRTFGLYGKNTIAAPWDLKAISEESGGIEWTMQRLGRTRYLDDRGFMSLEAVQEYGDFGDSAYSQIIEPLVTQKKTDAISSIISREKHQLRTFFEDGTSIVAAFENEQLSGFTVMNYQTEAGFGVPVRVTANGEDPSGKEILFFGSDEGVVYQMDSGTSFDGDPVAASLILTYFNAKSPARDKHWRKASLEADGATGTTLYYTASYDYASGREPVGITQQKILEAGGSYWDQAIWNEFSWASEDITLVEGYLDGDGRNISLQLTSSSIYTVPHTLYGITFHYSFRKLVR